jgi:hypothetical protein
MALVNCPECGQVISSTAKSCPSCGHAFPPESNTDPAKLLLEVRPSWWNFFWQFVFFWLLIPPLIAICRRMSLVMRIYPDRVSLERGLLSKEYRELFIKDIRSIDVTQSFLDGIFNIGDVIISSAATVDADEVCSGVPSPTRIRDLLIAQRQSAIPLE